MHYSSLICVLLLSFSAPYAMDKDIQLARQLSEPAEKNETNIDYARAAQELSYSLGLETFEPTEQDSARIRKEYWDMHHNEQRLTNEQVRNMYLQECGKMGLECARICNKQLYIAITTKLKNKDHHA